MLRRWVELIVSGGRQQGGGEKEREYDIPTGKLKRMTGTGEDENSKGWVRGGTELDSGWVCTELPGGAKGGGGSRLFLN